MKKIMVTGACGQIGSELVPALRQSFGGENVVAAGHESPIPDDMKASGPFAYVDVTDYDQVDSAMREHGVDTLFHLSSILSALAEQLRPRAWTVNFDGIFNVLEAAVANGLERVIVPSSIAAFGPGTPLDNTPNDTVQKPNTLYGISKVFTELMGNYYSSKLGLEVRGIRLPGIVSWKVEPTSGTTDYAVAIFYGAIRENRYTCFLGPDSRLPMMYMPDAIAALTDVATANGERLTHHSDFNVNAMSFTPAELADAIRKRLPGFEIDYEIDPLRQSIADSWPDKLDDTVARREWDWEPHYDLDDMVDDMLENLGRKLGQGGN
jgi:nucleoside-diphosphate-sugar epimerase